MKKCLMFSYSIVAYAIAFASIIYWILSVSNLIPEISIDREAQVTFRMALVNNLMLISLFGIQHSIMARTWFKEIFIKYFPKPIERSTFVLVSGLLLFNMIYNWQPLGAILWIVQPDNVLFYVLYVLFFVGWSILLVSSFIINHFDLFGLRQTFLEIQNMPYTELEFRITSFYKYVRHPLYFGMLLGMWATPQMSMTHFIMALSITIYVIVGVYFEEKDLVKIFGSKYTDYQDQKPKLIPFTKGIRKRNSKQLTVSGKRAVAE